MYLTPKRPQIEFNNNNSVPECQLEDGGAKSIIASEREGSIFSTSLDHGVCNGYIIPDGPKNPTLYLQRGSVNVTETRCDASSLQEENGRENEKNERQHDHFFVFLWQLRDSCSWKT